MALTRASRPPPRRAHSSRRPGAGPWVTFRCQREMGKDEVPRQYKDSFAEVAAAYRAAESLRPEAERVCYDPFARHFLGPWFRLLTSNRWLADLGMRYADSVAPGAPGEVLARTPFIDECLRKRIADGIAQMVILGAGYDTRAIRFQHLLASIKVFEVDQPATQAAKIEKARRLPGSISPRIVYVPVDFDKGNIEDQLMAHGYEPAVKTFFIWEGVTMYLTADGVDQTLAFVATRSAAASSIVFNYVCKAVVDGRDVSDAAVRWRAALEHRGAPVRFGIDEGQLEEFLAQRGLSVIERANSDLYRTYFAKRNRARPILSFMPIVHARVGVE